MTFRRSLKVFFAVALFLVVCVPLTTAVQPEPAASTDRVVAAPESPAPAPAAAARCGRCGDGQCVKSCGETATSCPADCGGVPQPSAAAAKCEVEAKKQ